MLSFFPAFEAVLESMWETEQKRRAASKSEPFSLDAALLGGTAQGKSNLRSSSMSRYHYRYSVRLSEEQRKLLEVR